MYYHIYCNNTIFVHIYYTYLNNSLLGMYPSTILTDILEHTYVITYDYYVCCMCMYVLLIHVDLTCTYTCELKICADIIEFNENLPLRQIC